MASSNSRFVRDPNSGLLVPRHTLRQAPPTRRKFLRGMAALGAAPLLGCGAEAEPVGSDAGATGDVSTGDVRVDTTQDVGFDTDATADAAADAAADAVTAAATFRFAVVADTHIIDEWYTGPENSPLDTESMFHTETRFTAVRDRIKSLETPVDFVVHLGDLIHDYPPGDLEFMATNTTRLDTAAALLDGFGVPTHMCFGNHDYEFRRVDREDTHAFFEEKLGVKPWSSFDHQGWKFIQLNSYTGATHAMDGPQGRNGSLGEEQLLWLEAELAEGKPTFIFIHQMLTIMETVEVADLGLHMLLERHKDTVAYVLSGHTHRWIDFGDQYGPLHRVIGATRYDEDCFVIAEVNVTDGTFQLLNEDTWIAFSPESNRWEEV